MIHDKNLKRLTGQDINISEINYDEIPNFAPEIDIHFSKDDQYVLEKGTQKKPDLLETFFKKFKDQPVVISVDIKSNSEEDLVRCLDMIKKYGMEDRVFIAIINKSNKMLKEKYGHFANAVSLKGGLLIIISFLLGSIFFFNSIGKKI